MKVVKKLPLNYERIEKSAGKIKQILISNRKLCFRPKNLHQFL